jgi:hypothetical protein
LPRSLSPSPCEKSVSGPQQGHLGSDRRRDQSVLTPVSGTCFKYQQNSCLDGGATVLAVSRHL